MNCAENLRPQTTELIALSKLVSETRRPASG